MQTLLFLIGLTIPLVSLATVQANDDIAMSDRIVGADLLAIACLTLFVLLKKIVLTKESMLYAVALTVAFGIGIFNSARGSYIRSLVGYAALLMAFAYFTIGVSASKDRRRLTPLLAGIICGVIGESVIVFHDYFLSSQWFPDRLDGRVRGTFRASGQLAAYGFATTGILLAFGRDCFDKRWMKWSVLACAGLASFFVIAASRRSGMASGVICLGAYVAICIGRGRLPLIGLLPTLGLLIFAGMLIFGDAHSSFLGQRIDKAAQSVDDGSDNFIIYQAIYVWERRAQWLPFGYGIGMPPIPSSSGVDSHELHNGHLSILVELGVFCLLCFYAIGIAIVRSCWRGRTSLSVDSRCVVVAFMISGAIFMVHNRLHRDRSFMLFLGIASGCISFKSVSLDCRRLNVLEERPPS